MNIWIAELETRHFSFRVTGTSEKNARHQMAMAWRFHAKEYSHANIAPFSDYEDGVNVWEAGGGVMLRDNSPIGGTS